MSLIEIKQTQIQTKRHAGARASRPRSMDVSACRIKQNRIPFSRGGTNPFLHQQILTQFNPFQGRPRTRDRPSEKVNSAAAAITTQGKTRGNQVAKRETLGSREGANPLDTFCKSAISSLGFWWRCSGLTAIIRFTTATKPPETSGRKVSSGSGLAKT